jgi:hypothetical protein
MFTQPPGICLSSLSPDNIGRRHPLQLLLSGHQVVLGLVSRVSSSHKSAAESLCKLIHSPVPPIWRTLQHPPTRPPQAPTTPHRHRRDRTDALCHQRQVNSPALIAPDSYRARVVHPNQSSTFVSTNTSQSPEALTANYPLEVVWLFWTGPIVNL